MKLNSRGRDRQTAHHPKTKTENIYIERRMERKIYREKDGAM